MCVSVPAMMETRRFCSRLKLAKSRTQSTKVRATRLATLPMQRPNLTDLPLPRKKGRNGDGRKAPFPDCRCRRGCEDYKRIRLCHERGQQRLRVFQIGGIEALGEPAVDGREQLTRFGPTALIAPQPRETRRRTQFIGFGLLPACDAKRLF